MDNEPFDYFGFRGGIPITGEYANFAAEVGFVIWAWNQLHGSLGDVFWQLSGIKDPVHTRAIWNAIKSDAGQRDILKALAVSHKKLRPFGPLNRGQRQFFYAIDEIVWLHDEVGKISGFRNGATHTMWSKEFQKVIDIKKDELPKVLPDSERGSIRGKSLLGKDINTTFRSLANYSYELSQYCNSICSWILMWGDGDTFPNRPMRPEILNN